MRAINLIPADQRRGSARGTSSKPSVGVYAVLGGLGAAVVCVLAFVLLSNSINGKTEELADLQTQSQGEKQVADALRPYGQFADMQRARQQQITTLTTGRFDWERALRQLSLAIPRNVYLLNVAATGSPDVQIDSGGGGGGALSNLRNKSAGPAFVMTGCTYSQHAVARMMTRMRNLDDVTGVKLGKSARKEDSTETTPAGPTATAETSQQNQDVSDCIGSSRVTKFDLMVEFGGSPTAAAATAAAGAAVAPAGTAAVAGAQTAAQTTAPAGGTQ